MGKKGVTMTELMVVLVIFALAISLAMAFFGEQAKRTHREAQKSKTILAGMVSDLLFVRDISMAGLGIPFSFSGQFIPIGNMDNQGPNGSDELIIRGAHMSPSGTDYMKWAYVSSSLGLGSTVIPITNLPEPGNSTINYPTFPSFSQGDNVIFLNPETGDLLGQRIYVVQSVGTNSIALNQPIDFSLTSKSALVFSLGGMDAGTSFSSFLNVFTGYMLSGTNSSCAPGTYSLRRFYGTAPASLQPPVMDCILDFQVEFGLVQQNGSVSWVNNLSGYTPQTLRSTLKFVRIFIVKQMGGRNQAFWFPNSSISVSNNTVNLTSGQRRYRWRILRLTVPLREWR